MSQVVRIIRGIAVATLAGALGGALVGMGESAFVSWTSGSSDEYWLFTFAVGSYGIIGALAGVAAAIGWQVLRLGQASHLQLAQVSAAVAAALPGCAVGRYQVAKRLFHEQLPVATAAGIITHVLLLLGAVVAAMIAVVLVRRLYRVAGVPALVGALAALALVAIGIGAVAGKPVQTQIARRPAPQRLAGKPNVILIIVDTLRADAVEAAVARGEAGSGFSRLARDAVSFSPAYAQASWTRPSIASIVTSQYPSVHGAMQKLDILPDHAVTLAEAFGQAGYWTTGFVTNINVAPVFNFQQGFDEYNYLEPAFYFWATDSAANLAIYKGLRQARERLFSKRIYFPQYYQDAAVLNQHVLSWLDEKPPEPFFLLMHYMDPHDPYFEIPYNGRGVARVSEPNPDPSRSKELHDLYLQNVNYLDRELDKFLERLKASGVYDRSVVVLVADHGEEFQDHGGWWHGTTLYDEALHVPLLFKAAGPPAPRRAGLARLIDVGPTLLGAAGLAVPPQFMGVDLFASAVDEPLLAEEDLEGNQLASIRAGNWKLITANPGNPRGLATVELYDVEKDGGERSNLARTEGARVSEMMSKLDTFRQKVAAAGRKNSLELGRRNAADPRS